MRYGSPTGRCKLCHIVALLDGGVCVDCNENPSRDKPACHEVMIRAVITNMDVINAIKEALADLVVIHEQNPGLGVGKIHDILAIAFKELESEPA